MKKLKLKVNEIRNEIIGKEMSFIELDNFMEENGYYSVFDDGATYCIKQDRNVVYTAKDTCECEVQIFFEIVYDSGEDECEESFAMVVKDVVKF